MSGPSPLGKALSRVADANLRYAALATKLAASALESAFSVTSNILPQAAPIQQAATQAPGEPTAEASGPGVAAILLEGKAGSTAVGFFVVQNSLPHEISTPVEVSAVTAPDGERIESALSFQPGRISLRAGEQVVARVTAKIGRWLAAGARYHGEIRVPGVPGAQIPIVLRRTAGTTPRKSEAVKKSRIAGETACATEASGALSAVGQTVPSASPACGRFFPSSSASKKSGPTPQTAGTRRAPARKPARKRIPG